MTAMAKRVWNHLCKLHASEQGAEGLEKLLIIGAIVLPLLGFLILFRDAIAEWLNERWGEVRDEDVSSGLPDPSNP